LQSFTVDCQPLPIVIVNLSKTSDRRTQHHGRNNRCDIWKNYKLDSDELRSLTKGDRVQLIPVEKDGKISHQIVLPGAPSATVPASKPKTSASPNYGNSHSSTSVTLVQRADDLARFYRYCHDLALREMGGELSADGAIPIALAIFQQALSH
jgi:hypothetical protein